MRGVVDRKGSDKRGSLWLRNGTPENPQGLHMLAWGGFGVQSAGKSMLKDQNFYGALDFKQCRQVTDL